MRNVFRLSVLAAGGVLFIAAVQALAADPSATAPATAPSTARVSDLLSLSVYGADNEKLGKIEDLVADPSSGKIRYAVLSFGGILGMGEKYFAVPWNDLRISTKGSTSVGTQKEEFCTLDVSKEALKNAPGFNKNQWPDFADPTFTKDIQSFYGSNRTAAKINGENR